MQAPRRRIAPSPHAAAARACRGSFKRMLALAFVQLLLRAAALLPLLPAVSGWNPLRFPAQHLLGLSALACLPLYIALVLPFRFQAGAELVRAACAVDRNTRVTPRRYLKWFAAGLFKAAAALPFLLPLAAFIGAFYYYWNMAGFNEFGLLIGDMGALAGGGYPEGVAAALLLFALAACLAAFGWRRVMPLDFQPVSEKGLRYARARAKAARGYRRRMTARVSLLNALIVLPAVAAVAAVFAAYVLGAMTGDIQTDVTLLLTLLTSFSFPPAVLLGAGAALALLYLPFVVFRKAALACAVERAGRAAEAKR